MNVEEFIAPEPIEHDQNLITAMEIRGQWLKVVPGTLELGVTPEGGVEFFVDIVGGGVVNGVLTEVTGLESLPYEEEEATHDGG